MHAGASPQAYARPLIPALLALMCGIVTGLYLPGFPYILPAVLAIFLICALIVRQKQRVRFLPLVLFLLLGYWSLQASIAPKLPANHVTQYIDDKPWHITGTLKGYPEHFSDRTRFVLQVETLTRNQASRSVTGAVRITVRGHIDGLQTGDRIGCLARLKEIRNFNNPGGFDYRQYMTFKKIWAMAYVSKEELLVKLHTTKAGRFQQIIDRARMAVSELIERAPPSDSRGILKAIVIGDRYEISPQSRELFSRIGISHLLAISGLHIGMVATLVFFAFRFLLARSQRILLAAWVPRGTALMAIVPVISYGFLAGMSPSTKRAVIMVTVFLLAIIFEREDDKTNTLALAALVILIITPTALFEISFQLSFTAVFCILYLLNNLALVSRLRSRPSTALKRLGLFMLVSAAAILGTLPITLYYFNQTSLIGVITNCIMVPLVGFIVVPLGLLAVLFLPLTQTLSLCIMKGAIFVMQGGLGLASLFSEIPFAAAKTVTPNLLEIALYYALAWALFNLRKLRWAKAVLLAVALIALADGGFWYWQRFCHKDLRVTFIDVGQGSATLLELPRGPCILVDGGGFYENRFDVGAMIVAPFLWQKKIATVEILVLSHPNSDHLNGLLFIARHFDVKEVWSNQEYVKNKGYQEFLDIIHQKDIRFVGLEELSKPKWINGIRFEVPYPLKDFSKRKAQEIWRTPNNNSLVLKAYFNKVSFLLPGDIEAEAEMELAHLSCEEIDSNVLLAPHHGSKTSSTPRFLGCVDPSVAVISAGWKNIFGFPHKRVLKRYKKTGCKILRTDEAGAITITTDGVHMNISTFLSD